MEGNFDDTFLNVTEFQKVFGHDPGKDQFVLKIAVVGYPGTGKSAFIKKFCNQVFPTEHLPSMHTELTSEVIRVSSSIIVEVFLYEIAGQTQYIDLKNLFACGIKGIILMFGHHYPHSFDKIPYLNSFINKYMETKVPKLLVGNVFDDKPNFISWDQGNKMAKSLDIDFMQVNVKRNSKNIDNCIGYFISKLISEINI
jgi:GTPase SAR1 family protein